MNCNMGNWTICMDIDDHKNVQDIADVRWLTDLNLRGCGLDGKEASRLTASVYYNRLQDWEKFRVAAAI